MGLFSSKKKTIVGLTTVPMIPEQSFFNESIIGSIFSQTNIAQSISAELRNGWIGKANMYYRETKKRLNTESGRATFVSYTPTTSIEQILNPIIGEPISVIKSDVSQFDVTYSAYEYLFENYTVNLDNDEVTGVIPATVLIFKQAYVANNKLNIVLTKPDNTEHLIELNDYTFGSGEYFHLIYATTALPNSYKVWFYEINTGLYPQINQTIFSKDYNDYFPSIIIRKNKVNTVDVDNDYKKYASRILSNMGADLDFITEQIMSNEEGVSDVVDDAFITFGLNIQDKYPGSIQYLYEYFYRIFLDIPDSKQKFDAWINRETTVQPEYYIKYKDDDFNTYIEWNYITYEIKEGNLEEKYERETIIRPPERLSNLFVFRGVYDNSDFILRKKLTENTYAEITVNGLGHATEIVQGYLVYRTLEDSLKVPDENNEEDSAFYIPLSKTIVDSLPMIAKKQVLYAAFTLPIYTVQIIKIKWYQRGAFKALLFIIAIIVTILTVDFSGSALQIAIAIASQVIAAVIIGELLKIAVDILEIENALILAVIATAVAIYGDGYSTQGLMWARQLLQLATLSFNAIGSEIQDEFVKLQNEISNFLQDAKEIQEDIDNAAALLDNSKYSFLDVAAGRMYFNPYETPDQFYSRSAYDQNPGVKSFDMLYNYVDRMLKLPEHRYV